MEPSNCLREAEAKRVRTEPGVRRDERQTAIVVLPLAASGAPPARDPDLRLEEAKGLAEALDLAVADAAVVRLRALNPATYLGEGRVAALKEQAGAASADVIVIDAALSPVQQRNLENALAAKVVDRTGLILEIFARRARTREGRLQVELARLAYERSRLVRTWTHLERQRGGLGKTGGPGETQIELDRRQIAARIIRLKRELEDVRRTRALQRRARARAGYPAVVLVGYTNAGKSSLFNRISSADVLAKDMPFATLDPTARLIALPSGRTVIVADTVGFITDLPTELIAAFRATLEAVMEADLLVHVRDIAHPETEAQRADVLAVLAQVAAESGGRALPPMLEAWNKIDRLDPERRAGRLARAAKQGGETPLPVSALTGEGVDALLDAVDRAAFGAARLVDLILDPADGKTRAWIAARGRITDERVLADGRIALTAELAGDDAARLDPALIASPETLAAE
ncbi:MAG: GTPase HflX [Alphaproteobacteria bacterium]|nr:GTPase HflX [Alphaproteobacteria bacterium]